MHDNLIPTNGRFPSPAKADAVAACPTAVCVRTRGGRGMQYTIYDRPGGNVVAIAGNATYAWLQALRAFHAATKGAVKSC